MKWASSVCEFINGVITFSLSVCISKVVYTHGYLDLYAKLDSCMY